MRNRLFLLGMIFFLASSARATQAYLEQDYSVPMTEANGQARSLHTKVCTPQGAKAAPVAILNHGSPPKPADRATYVPYACDSEVAQWFLAKGYIVVSPLRRGYGATGGKWVEGFGKCEHPDFFGGGLTTARDMRAVIDFISKIPNANADRIAVIGQSAGGWGTIALNSLPHPHVKALINMAGGRGGHHGPKADQNCSPEMLAKAAEKYGATSSTPMLWVYAENDSYFAPVISKALWAAFVKGGGKATFVLKPPFGDDGHKEFSGKKGSQVWGKDFEDYLAAQMH